MRTNTFSIFIALFVCILAISCADPLGITDLFCTSVTSCINGSGFLVRGECICICDKGFCGDRCAFDKSTCKGTVTDPVDASKCECICPSLGVLQFEPPECAKVHIPLFPDDGDGIFSYSNPKKYKVSDPDYFPLNLSNSWTYSLLDSMGQESSQFGMMVDELFSYEDTSFISLSIVLPDSTGEGLDTVAGPLLFELPPDSNQIYYYATDRTSSLFQLHNYENEDTLVLNDTEAFIENIGSVTVPAGTFDNCIRALDADSSGFVLAPDLGLIANITEGEFTAVLSEMELACNVSVELTPVDVSCGEDNDGMINFEIIGDPSGLVFHWDGPTDIADNEEAVQLSPGLYSVTVSNGQCQAIVTDIPIEQPASIQVQIDNLINPSCSDSQGGTIQITVSGGSEPYQYSWNDGAYLEEDLEHLEAGCYDLIVMDNEGCTQRFSVEITAEDGPQISSQVVNVSCAGQSDGSLFLEISGGTPAYSIEWNTGESSDLIDNLGPGDYSVTVTDINNCSTSSEQQITEPEAINLTLTSTPSSGSTDDGSATVEVNGGTADYTFQWNDPASQTTATASDLGAGDYTVTVTDANGCTVTETITVEMSTSTDDIIGEQPFHVFPNPLSQGESLFLEFKNRPNLGSMDIIIYNALGKILKRIDHQEMNDMELSTSDLSPGLYFLNVSYNDQLFSKRIVIIN